DDGDVEEMMMIMMVVVWWWVWGGGGSGGMESRVGESDMGDRIDPLMRSIFGVRRKESPEKFSGGRRWWPAAAEGGRKNG
ncbi:hypothetical protein Tco_1309173, partial [Tanacetum coccineum]